MNEFQPHKEQTEDLGWRVYQPSWPEALLTSFGLCGFFGALSWYNTGDIVAMELALAVAVPLCGFFRWIWPRYKHLQWGDPE